MSRAVDVLILLVLVLGNVFVSRAADIADARKNYLSGNYSEVITSAEKATAEKDAAEDWFILLAQSLYTTGQNEKARGAIAAGLKAYDTSIRLRYAGQEILRASGFPDEARKTLEEIYELATNRRWAYRDSTNFIVLGRTVLLLSADPRQVLDNFYEVAKKMEPNNREVYLAMGDLAIGKEDFALASTIYAEGLKRFPKDADFLSGLARSYSESDRTQMVENLEAALDANPKHVPSLLQVTDHLIDSENYEEAAKTVTKVLAVNPQQAEGWAYRAVLAHLRNKPDDETKARREALKRWTNNPAVDHLIGEKLSQKYRFVEGAAYQRKALEFDANFLAAKLQLADDLLRLGQETEGWELAHKVHDADGYDVLAYNLVTLEETLDQFTVLTNNDFVVKMFGNEAKIYGDRVLDLLGKAKQTLCQKYGLALNEPVTVEIFPEQKDFAIRTFGLPGGQGYLGVCFGSVITVNGPSAQKGRPSNWQSVLWHEFCHVVTLHLTRNKMPRWLSEGISVFEEREAGKGWGQKMDPHNRELIMKGKCKPIGDLSGAFLTASDSADMQFAYFESSLVAEFIARKFGLEKVKTILKDLGEGAEINATLEANLEPLPQLDKDFAAYAKHAAEQLGPGLNWDKPARGLGEIAGGEDVLSPMNFWVMSNKARKFIEAKQWQEAAPILEKLIELYPEQTGADSSYALLAAVERALNKPGLEEKILSDWAAQDDEALDAYARLMEVEERTKNWKDLRLNAERFIAVNPLAGSPYRYLAEAHEGLREPEGAIKSYETVLLLDPPNPSDIHFRLASLFDNKKDPRAKREVLLALEEAPRFKAAYELLLKFSGKPE